MSRGQCAIICAFLGTIAVGVFIVAFMANVGVLNGGTEINQHARGGLMLAGAGVGFVLGALFGGPTRTAKPSAPSPPPVA